MKTPKKSLKFYKHKKYYLALSIVLTCLVLIVITILNINKHSKLNSIPTPSPSSISTAKTTLLPEHKYTNIELDAFGVEITKSQYNTLMNIVGNTNEVATTDEIATTSGGWKSWSGAQLVTFISKNTTVCEIINISWCGTYTPEEVANQCSTYQIKEGELPPGNGSHCCQAYITKRPYVFTCVDSTELSNPDLENNKQLTYNILKELGVTCNQESCLSPVKKQTNIYIP